MANVVIVGTQWGDEGKGKITDLLAADADLVARVAGGDEDRIHGRGPGGAPGEGVFAATAAYD